MTDLDASPSAAEEHPPPYIIFILVFFFFVTGLLGFLVCHLLQKKGYHCRTVDEEEEDIEEKLALPDDDLSDEEEDENQDTVEQILKCIIENEANMEAFKEMLGNQNICEHHDARLLRKQSLGGIPPHHHTVHAGSDVGHNSCHLCAQGRSRKARRRSRAAAQTKTRTGEQTVFSVGRFRVTHTDKKPNLQGSTNLPTAESGDQLDHSEPLDSEKGEGSHRKEGYNLRNMFKDVKPESTNGVTPKRRKSLFSLRRGSDPQGVKVTVQPVVLEEGYHTRALSPSVLEEAEPTGPRQTSSPVSASGPAPGKTPSPTLSQAPTSTPSPAPTPSPILPSVPVPSPSPTSAHSTTPDQTSTPTPTSAKSPAPTPTKFPSPNPSLLSAHSLPPPPSPTPGTAPSPPSAQSPTTSPAPAPASSPTPTKSSAPTPSPPSVQSLIPTSCSPRLELNTKVTSTQTSPRPGSPFTPEVPMYLGSTFSPPSPLPASPSTPLHTFPSYPLVGHVTIVKASPDSTREFSVVRMVELEGEEPSTVKPGFTAQGEVLVTQPGAERSAGKKPATMEELQKDQAEGIATMEEGPATMEEGPDNMEEGPATMEEGPATMEEGPATMEEGTATMEEGPMALKEEPRDEMVQMEDIRGCRVSQGKEAEEEQKEMRRPLHTQ